MEWHPEVDPEFALAWDLPFTPAMAARAGVGRAAVDRLHRTGQVHRLLRGVYLDAAVEVTAAIRARAVALRVDRRHVAVRRTAAWIHGIGFENGVPVPVEVHRSTGRATAQPLGAGDLVEREGLRYTSGVRTALDLGRALAPERALPLIDGLLRIGAASHPALLAACAGQGERLRELIARADGRAVDATESVLRLRWLEASLPTPTPGFSVLGCRLALGLCDQRFGVALVGQITAVDLDRCARAGWQVTLLDRGLLAGADAFLVTEHLEREFHQHLLGQVIGAPGDVTAEAPSLVP